MFLSKIFNHKQPVSLLDPRTTSHKNGGIQIDARDDVNKGVQSAALPVISLKNAQLTTIKESE